MLLVQCDPVLDHGVHNSQLTLHHASPVGLPAAPVPRFARLMIALQMAGTVLAIPLGLASGYSIYRANFSPEANCQGLRANIISMLDKSADASTLRLLVHRDVVAFEHSCGTIDPDAVAAFKTLLAPRRPIASAVPRVSAPPKQRVEVARKPNGTKSTTVVRSVERDPESSEAARSDATWLAAVRHALVHDDHRRATRRVETAPAVFAPVPIRRVGVPISNEGGSAARVSALRLPTATSMAAPPAVRSVSGHPVPPALIPDVAPSARGSDATHPLAGVGSRFATQIAHIPFVGYKIDDRPQ